MGDIERLEPATKRLNALGRRSRLGGAPLGEDLYDGKQVLDAVGSGMTGEVITHRRQLLRESAYRLGQLHRQGRIRSAAGEQFWAVEIDGQRVSCTFGSERLAESYAREHVTEITPAGGPRR